MSYGFVALEAFLFPSEDEIAIDPVNVKIRDICIESGVFDPKTNEWIEGVGILFPCGHDFSINAYNNLWFWLSQKLVEGLIEVLPPEEEFISAAERTNAAFWFQNKCRTCGQRAEKIIPNYALRDMIEVLKEYSSKESSRVQDVWERLKDSITTEQMKDPVIMAPCGHSVCGRVWKDPAFERFKGRCQECKQDCDATAKNLALKLALKVLNKHFLSEELAKLSQENVWNAQEVVLEDPEHLLKLRDASISIDALSKLAPFIQTTILRKPNHFIGLLEGTGLSMEDFSSISIFDQATALAADLDSGIKRFNAGYKEVSLTT